MRTPAEGPRGEAMNASNDKGGVTAQWASSSRVLGDPKTEIGSLSPNKLRKLLTTAKLTRSQETIGEEKS